MAEKANAIGYGLILLYPDTFVEKLKAKVPAAVALPDQLRQQIDQIANVDQRNKAFAAVIDHLYAKQQQVSGLAHTKTIEITDAVRQSGSREDDGWKRESGRIASLLLSADAYATFRHAQAPDADGKVRTEAEFIRLCEDALRKLHEADAQQPNQYIVLQNLGMIYGDPRYDVRNEHIVAARRYFERSSEIKPNDYYGLQSQAVLAVRQGYAWGVDLTEEPFKSVASKAAESLKQRPGNGTVFVAQAQLAALSWAADETNRKKWEASFNAALANARRVRANPARIRVAQLQWGLLQLRAAAADPAPPTEKTVTGGGVTPAATGPAAVPAAQSSAVPATDPQATPAPEQKLPVGANSNTQAPVPVKPAKGTFSYEKAAYLDELKSAIKEAATLPGWEAQQLDLVARSLTTVVEGSTSDKRDGLTWPSSPLSPPP